MYLTLSDDDAMIVRQASDILKRHLVNDLTALSDPQATRHYLQMKVAHLEHEVFGVIFVNTRNRVIDDQIMFRGTIDGAAVYPREIAKEALRVNAAGMVLYHNHPGGNPEPSRADRVITNRIKEALELFDIRINDHLVIGSDHEVSFAERGLI